MADDFDFSKYQPDKKSFDFSKYQLDKKSGGTPSPIAPPADNRPTLAAGGASEVHAKQPASEPPMDEETRLAQASTGMDPADNAAQKRRGEHVIGGLKKDFAPTYYDYGKGLASDIGNVIEGGMKVGGRVLDTAGKAVEDVTGIPRLGRDVTMGLQSMAGHGGEAGPVGEIRTRPALEKLMEESKPSMTRRELFSPKGAAAIAKATEPEVKGVRTKDDLVQLMEQSKPQVSRDTQPQAVEKPPIEPPKDGIPKKQTLAEMNAEIQRKNAEPPTPQPKTPKDFWTYKPGSKTPEPNTYSAKKQLANMDRKIEQYTKDLSNPKIGPIAKKTIAAEIKKLKEEREHAQKFGPGLEDAIARGAKAEAPQPSPLGAAAPKGGAKLPLHERPMDMVTRATRAQPAVERTQSVAARAADTAKGALARGTHALKQVFGRDLDASAGRAKGQVQEGLGLADRDRARTTEAVESIRAESKRLPPDRQDAITDYVEGHRDVTLNPREREIADALKEAYEQRRAKLEDLDEKGTAQFVDDYARHVWVDPDKVRAAFQKADRSGTGAKLGSSGFTKKRSIPTTRDGRTLGLEPVSRDPIENMLKYIQTADRYIARQNIIRAGRETRDIRYYTPGKAPPGLVELDAIPQKTRGPGGPPIRAYANEGYAKIWNNFVSTAGPTLQTVTDSIRASNNFIHQALFSIGAFHPMLMIKESFSSGFMNAVQNLSRGDIKGAAYGLGRTLRNPIDPFLPKSMSKGRQFRDAYLDKGGTELMKKIADIGARVNFRAVGYDKSLKAGIGSITKSIMRGTVKLEMQDAARRVMSRGSLYSKGTGAVVEASKALGKMMGTYMEPVFEHMIPSMRRTVFYDQMSDFIRSNPLATDEQLLAYGRQLSDTIDNRFGEMNTDNLPWNATNKAILQSTFLSYSWTLGKGRLITGALEDALNLPKDLKSGKGIGDNMAWVMGLAMSTAVLSTVYQYVKTGKAPQSAKDLVYPQTGGTAPQTDFEQKTDQPVMPERAATPGDQKEIIAYIKHPLTELHNKLDAYIKFMEENITQQDWKGQPTYDVGAGGLERVAQTLLKSIGDNFTPFGVQLAESERKGSNIGTAERYMGVRPAPTWAEKPESVQGFEDHSDVVAHAKKAYGDANASDDPREKELYSAFGHKLYGIDRNLKNASPDEREQLLKDARDAQVELNAALKELKSSATPMGIQ